MNDDSQISTMYDLVWRAERGELGILPQLSRFLANQVAVFQQAADLAKAAEEAQINLIAGQNQPAREAIRGKLDEQRRKLAEMYPSPLEGLLIDQVITLWAHSMYAQVLAARAKAGAVRHAKTLQRRADRAVQQLNAAVRTLSTVHKAVQPKSPRKPKRPAAPADAGGQQGDGHAEPDKTSGDGPSEQG